MFTLFNIWKRSLCKFYNFKKLEPTGSALAEPFNLPATSSSSHLPPDTVFLFPSKLTQHVASTSSDKLCVGKNPRKRTCHFTYLFLPEREAGTQAGTQAGSLESEISVIQHTHTQSRLGLFCGVPEGSILVKDLFYCRTFCYLICYVYAISKFSFSSVIVIVEEKKTKNDPPVLTDEWWGLCVSEFVDFFFFFWYYKELAHKAIP